MNLIALDTALDACSVSVLAGDRVAAFACEPMTRGHQERLAPMAAEVMARAGLGFAALDRVAVTVGPGSFTGVRVGLAFAKGLAMALDLPCLGVGTLEALAAGLPGRVAAVLDAKRGQVYLQAFDDGQALDEARPMDVVKAAASLSGLADLTLVGSGAPLLAPLLPEATMDPRQLVDPEAFAFLAAVKPPPAERPRPLYLRAPDARTLAERQAGREAELAPPR